MTWRLVVDRPPSRRPVPEGVRVPVVDTFDCVAWTAATRRAAQALSVGDVVEVTGALRRRFWRTGAGAASPVRGRGDPGAPARPRPGPGPSGTGLSGGRLSDRIRRRGGRARTRPVRGLGVNSVDLRGIRSPPAATFTTPSTGVGLSSTAVPAVRAAAAIASATSCS